MKKAENNYGAVLERGRVVQAENGKFRVESLDRPGIISPPITFTGTQVPDVGDGVFFALFDDGDGVILWKR